MRGVLLDLNLMTLGLLSTRDISVNVLSMECRWNVGASVLNARICNSLNFGNDRIDFHVDL